MQPQIHTTINISHSSDVSTARLRVKALAKKLEFDKKSIAEITIVVSELSSNLVKYANKGVLKLSVVNHNQHFGIQIDALDSGPGIIDIDQAMTDGFSTGGGLGFGLGAANRLMDVFEIQSQQGIGTQIRCIRWLQRNPIPNTDSPLQIGVATRAHPHMQVNGDTYVVKQWENFILVSVIDGVGHGALAYEAAQTARTYIENHYDQPLESIFQNVDYLCRATRGVVMAIARFDWQHSSLTFANVGNIEARVFKNFTPLNFVIRRGVIGYNAPKPVISEHPWLSSNILVLHSDGMKTSWHLDEFPELHDKPASIIARELLNALARGNDDATVIVVRGGSDE